MKPHNLIGHAGRLADLLSLTLAGKEKHKLLFYGPCGCGKTTLANHIAEYLTESKFSVESVNGRHVTIHVVKAWQHEFATSSLYGTGFRVVVVNEIDLCQRDAQDALLSFLDDMPARRAFIGTSNLELGDLTERFRTRFQRYEVKPPSDVEIRGLLVTQEGIPAGIAKQIAVLAGGNVRAALLDAEAWQCQQPQPAIGPIEIQGSLAAMGF